MVILFAGGIAYIAGMIALSQGDKPLRAIATSMFGGIMIAFAYPAGEVNRKLLGEFLGKLTRRAFIALGGVTVAAGLVVMVTSLLE
jgi:hypothetical protein